MFLAIALWIAAPAPTPLSGCAWVRAENDGAGAGFVVDTEKRLLVTCRHVVAERKKVDVFFRWIRDGELVTDRREYLRNRDTLRAEKLLVTGTVLKTADEFDLALVQLDALPPTTTAITFAATSQLGDELRVVGNRLDLDTVWNLTTGPLRARGKLTDGYFWRGKKLAANAPVLIGQLPIEEGDSGGPVFNSRGELVGMASALRRQCPLAAVVISGETIRRFVNADLPAKKPEPARIADALLRATVWVKPTTTDVHIAGVLIEKNLVLTCARGLTPGDRVGVALPLRENERVSERDSYRDPLTLYLREAWRSGIVLARDTTRDLALIRLDSDCVNVVPLPLAEGIPQAGDAIHTMNHPGGLEFAWVYASGSVRQRGIIALDVGEKALRVSVLVCQFPAQAGSPGGPVVNAKGELVGVQSTREGAQLVGYCVTTDEIRAFLDVARFDRPARTLAGLLARVESIPARSVSALARGLAERGELHRQAGRIAEAKRDCDAALWLDPGCVAGYLCRMRLIPNDAIAELDAAIEKGSFNRDVLVLRAELVARAKDFRKARGDLERVLNVFPADAEARQQLARVQFALGEDAKAAIAIRDTLRADPKRLHAVVIDLREQTDTLKQKFPDLPGVPADWLTKALFAAREGTSDAQAKATLAALLKAASATKDAAERLRVLLAGVKELK